MKKRHNTRSHYARGRIAQEAARLMIEGGIHDFHLAKRKAVTSLRLPESVKLPGNEEVEEAIQSYQRLFLSDLQPGQLKQLRNTALNAMKFLERFRPRLVGSVLSGTADANSEICLHLFSQTAEDLTIFLMDRGVEFQQTERRLKMSSGEFVRMPAFRLVADGAQLELIVFSDSDRRHPPLSPVDGRPMRRANIAEVASLAARLES